MEQLETMGFFFFPQHARATIVTLIIFGFFKKEKIVSHVVVIKIPCTNIRDYLWPAEWQNVDGLFSL